MGREARAGERGDRAATERGEDCRRSLSDRTSCKRESSPENTSFDVLGLASAMRLTGHRSSGEAVERSSLPSLRLACHPPPDRGPASATSENRCFAATHQGEDSSTRPGDPEASGYRARSNLIGIRSGATEPTARRIGRPALDSSERSIFCSARVCLELSPVAPGMLGGSLWLSRPSTPVALSLRLERGMRGPGSREPVCRRV